MTRLRSLSIAFLLAAPLASHAASFDCAKASSPVEKAICASPQVSEVDGTLGQVFTAAMKNHPDKAAALKIDQQHWLAERDDETWGYLSTGLNKELSTTLAQTYQRRIAFLKALDTAAVPKPLDTIVGALSSSAVVEGDLMEGLAQKDAHITLAKDVEIDEAKPFRLHPDAKLADALKDAGDRVTDRDLAGSPVGAMYTIEGTAHCWNELPYRIEGNKALTIDSPPVWGDGDCMSSHQLATIDGSVTAISLTAGDAVNVLLSTSQWDGKTFGPEASIDLRFNRVLSLTGSACAPKQSPCSDFGTVALAAATRYDRRPLPGVLDRAISGANKAAYDALLAAARAKGGIASIDAADEPVELPDFGTDVTSSHMSFYGKEATTFPIDFHGETLLGLIGHSHMGWRDSDDWMVSAWRLKNGKLEPVASAYIELKRGPLLLSAVVPSP